MGVPFQPSAYPRPSHATMTMSNCILRQSFRHATQLLCVAASLFFSQVSAATPQPSTSMGAYTTAVQVSPASQAPAAPSSTKRSPSYVWRHVISFVLIILAPKLSQSLTMPRDFWKTLTKSPLCTPESWFGAMFMAFVPILAACFATWFVADTDPSKEPYTIFKETMAFTIVHCLPFLPLGLSLYCKWVPQKYVFSRKGNHNLRIYDYQGTLQYWIYGYLFQLLIVWIMDLVTVFLYHQTLKAETKPQTKPVLPSEAS